MIIKKESILAGDQSQFNVLLRTHFAEAQNSVQQEPSLEERTVVAKALLAKTFHIDWANSLVETAVADIEKKCGQQSALFKAEICFSVQVIQKFAQGLALDGQLKPVVIELQNILLAHAIFDSQFWWQEHPLKKIVDLIIEQMLGWDDSFANTSKSLKALAESTVEKLAALPLQDKAAIEQCFQQATKDFNQLMDKFTRLANRLKDAEVGLLKAAAAQKAVAMFVNKVTREQKLPIFITQFIQGKFLNEMQLLIIQQGEDSSLWLRWKKLLETAIKYYQQETIDPSDVSSKSIMVNLPNEIEKLIKESVQASDAFTDFCNEIAYDFSRKAMGEKLDNLLPITPLPIEGETEGVEKKVTQVLINKAKNYPLGQWFIYKNEAGAIIRCRLLFNITEFNQLLFVSLVGQKALTLDYEKFAYLLSAKHIQALPQLKYLQQAFTVLIDKLMDNFNTLYEAKQSLQKRQKLEAKLAQEENEKRLAAEKARAEAEAIAERKAAEEQKGIMAKIADDLKRQARLAINAMAIGAWVDMQCTESKDFKRIKLAVKYNATGRYVFVDADGITMADIQRDDLVELMMKRKFKLLDSDKQFSERLATIVKDIRKV